MPRIVRSPSERFANASTLTLSGIYALVNNAGISGPTVPVEEMNPGAWDTVRSGNLLGNFDVTRLSPDPIGNRLRDLATRRLAS